MSNNGAKMEIKVSLISMFNLDAWLMDVNMLEA